MSDSTNPANIISERPPLAALTPVAVDALRQYGIVGAKLRNLRYYNNATYRVIDVHSDGAKYVLRVTPNYYTRANLEAEMRWLLAMQADPDLHVPAPLAALDGSLVVVAPSPTPPRTLGEGVMPPTQPFPVVKGEASTTTQHSALSTQHQPSRLCVLFRWMEGAKVDEERMQANHFHLVGEGLARMHRQSEYFHPPADFARPSWDDRAFFSTGVSDTYERILAHLRGYFSATEVKSFITLTEQARATMREFTADPTYYGLIHADFHAGNYLFHKGTVRFIDFEDLSWGYFLYDIATALFGIIERPDYAPMAASMIDGYSRIMPLPDQLALRLKLFQILRCIFLTTLVVTRGSLAESKWWEGYVARKLKRLLQDTSAD